ncbi:hypothetical protein ABIE67_001114 [Streptomyces sp. V4I8]|uniref:hypothetical protein n=1 Tax=Streptomyces sp. V4I8 TaxID=3156469 RepID=UPI0035179ADB
MSTPGEAELVERVDEHDQILAVVSRSEAIRHGWLHRIATIVCRAPSGRLLVHRRPDHASRFPGRFFAAQLDPTRPR